MDTSSRLFSNIALIALVGVLLKIVTLYYPDYSSKDFSLILLPCTTTGLLFLAALLNPKRSSCRKTEVIMGCIGLVVCLLCYMAANFHIGGHF